MKRSPIIAARFAIALGVLSSPPALAGEVTGAGTQIDSSGRSICKFSGLNDGDGVTGTSQSFGQNVSGGWTEPFIEPIDPDLLLDDRFADMAEEEFGNPGGLPDLQFHPGSFCNPTNLDSGNTR